MASVSERIRISAPADDVWQTVRDFGAIDEYLPPVATAELSGQGVGATRTLTLEDGAQIIERLDGIDEDARTLRYSIIEGPLPIENYESTLSVTAIDESACEVRWASDFDVVDAPEDEVASTLAELYTAGLAGLNERHAAPA